MKTTNELLNILKNTEPSEIENCLQNNRDSFVGEHAFTDYVRSLLKKKELTQQDVFRAAEIPERYGYRIVSGERITRQRDIVLRLCIAGHFTLKETQQALELYGMPVLYARSERDAVMIIAVNKRVYDVHRVDEMLREHGMDVLRPCGNDVED